MHDIYYYLNSFKKLKGKKKLMKKHEKDIGTEVHYILPSYIITI